MSFDMEMEEYHEDIELKKKYKEELEKLQKEMTEEAKKVREDYVKNPSKMSGSYIHIHENSPYLAEEHERLITFNKKDLVKKKNS
tara:strand:- start:63 stop:317 length:255 start_codon:yes stop_codon:yes gene_type:complete